ncbi:T9SS type A sorting domain-containing protein [Geofilum rubicundum]|uniref:Secretion system C-terminal sorting domain-containing protein n=1 Tax=Geofilum rubicundum JCM 15548 TaxID=1236989 RepID=A0A0E9M3C3_9BACT|nr:T9SS type A sorting domain-containing protein [Geofilum rubicundum]GAO31670.1 hypothetical protein JCM15548_14058 [Geofilum rubicundum JCM 15548]
MRHLSLLITLFLLTSGLISQSQIIADHTIVADYDKIPPHYINEVKKMMVSFPGASHSTAYRVGLNLLESQDPTYQVNIAYEEAYTTAYLRCNNIGRDFLDDEWYSWFAWPEGERPEAANSVKDMIKRNYDNNRPISVIGYGWCWIMMSSYHSREYDPEHKVRWWGSTRGGPDAGTLGWGLNAEDFAITGNRVSLETYLNATLDYVSYCTANNYPTKIAFTTGPVDKYTGEQAYQAYIKHEHIRNFVKEDPTRLLFDYADILCYDDNGQLNTETWTYDGVTYTFPFITDTNLGDKSVGHIGTAGALRLAKATWWFLARIAGWDGETTTSELPTTQSDIGFSNYQQNQQLVIDLDTPLVYNGQYTVHSILGTRYETAKINGTPIIINTGRYPPGVYIVTLSGIKTTHFKVVVM